MKKFLAFTLAETLIVMGIIGIVSALTLPNLNASTGEKEKVAKVKKLYQNINDAVGRATAVYGPINEWFVNDADEQARATRLAERMTEFMKITKTCGYGSTNTACFDVSKIGGSLGAQMSSAYKFISADGSSFAVTTLDTQGTLMIMIDIDGPNKGNGTYGKDVFWFYLDNQGAPIMSGTDVKMEGDFTAAKNYSNFGWGGSELITYWVLQNDNMDYLKVDSSGKCPNGKTLNWQNQISCK